MIYDKLPVVFLSTIASEKKDTTNSLIASYILQHLDDMHHIGIKQMAAECNVAFSSISRFCREIGLRDFSELKELLRTTDLRFEQACQGEDAQRMHAYTERVRKSVMMTERSLDPAALDRLCRDLASYERIAAFGLLKAGCAALSLQADLLMLGRQIYTNISYAEQIRYLEKTDRSDLVLIFSYTGTYFESHDIRLLGRRLTLPKIWLITGGREKPPGFIDEVLRFDSGLDQISHPYQLQICAGIIAQLFAARQNGKDGFTAEE